MSNGSHDGDGLNTGRADIALVDLARLRQGAYRLFSQSLLYPDEQRLKTLALVAAELRREGSTWASFAFFPDWNRFLGSLEGLRHLEPTTVQAEYVSSFMVNSAGVPCPIYESAYVGDDPSAIAWILGQLDSEYAAAGLVSSTTRREPPDHAVVEMEFLSFLCGKEAEAWEDQDLPGAIGSVKTQLNFLQRHPAWWIPEFARKVATTIDSNGVLAAVSQATATFLLHDTDLLSTLLQRLEGLKEVQ